MDKNQLKKLFLGSLIVIIGLFPVFTGQLRHSIELLNSMGLTNDIIYLILIIPFISLFIAISRIIVGINISTILVTTLIIISYFLVGVPYTAFFFICCGLIALLIKFLLNELHIHFSVKMPTIISMLFVIILLSLPELLTYFDLKNGPVVILIISAILGLISEKFLTFKMTHAGILSDLKNILKTIAFALLFFLVLGGKFELLTLNFQWLGLKNLILNFPESIVACLIASILIGRYTGLRISEIIRFRKLIFKSK